MEDKFLAQSMGMSMLFEDPITFEIMENATVAACGHSFSESTIKEYVAEEGKCPLCNKTLQPHDLLPNYKLREAISQYQKYKEQEASKRASAGGGQLNDDEEEEVIAIPRKIDAEALVKQINPNFKSKRDEEKIIVEIIAAKGLRNHRGLLAGTSSPYCKIQFQGRIQQTTTMKANLNPTWNECFLFEVKNDEGGGPVRIEVRDRHMVGRDTLMGSVDISWDRFSDQKLNDDFPIVGSGKKDRNGGTLSLRIRHVNLRNLKEDSDDDAEAEPKPEVVRVKAESRSPIIQRHPVNPDPPAAPIVMPPDDGDIDEQMARALQNQFDLEGQGA